MVMVFPLVRGLGLNRCINYDSFIDTTASGVIVFCVTKKNRYYCEWYHCLLLKKKKNIDRCINLKLFEVVYIFIVCVWNFVHPCHKGLLLPHRVCPVIVGHWVVSKMITINYYVWYQYRDNVHYNTNTWNWEENLTIFQFTPKVTA